MARRTTRSLPLLTAALLLLGGASGDALDGGQRFATVVIDAGHGGDDHGAEGSAGLVEKDVALDLARRLAARLRKHGLRVVMTRDGDDFVSLSQRTEIANGSGADLFISIHANASSYRAAGGVETYFASPEATDEAARALAAAENLAFGPNAAAIASDDPVRAILGDLIATEYLTDSQEFARMAQEEITTVREARSRGVKQAPFVVLMGVHMPAVLVEVGFITNLREERALAKVAERDRLADGLAEAVEAFRTRHDARLVSGRSGHEEG